MKRKIAAILAADIAGYSRLVAEDEEETLRRLAVYRGVFEDFVTRAGGRVFNTAGDGFMAEFPSAVDAVRCAIDAQESLRTRNLAYPTSRQMAFRMGLTIGDVVDRDGDLLGDGVNIAARLETLAEPGRICISKSVYDAVANKLSVQFTDLGAKQVKNIPNPVHVFSIATGEPSPPAKPTSGPDNRRAFASSPIQLAAAVVVALLAGAAVAMLATGLLPPAKPKLVLKEPSKPAPTLPPSEVQAEAPAKLSPLPPKAEAKASDESEKVAAKSNVESAATDIQPSTTNSSTVENSPPAEQSASSKPAAVATTEPPSAPQSDDIAALGRLRPRWWNDCKGTDSASAATACRRLIDDGGIQGADLALAHEKLAFAERQSGQLDDAIASFTKSIEIAESSLAYDERGTSYFLKGQLNDAITDYDRAIALDSNNGDAFNNRAWTNYKLGRIKEAKADADKAQTLLPNKADVWDTRGHIFETLGDRSEAIKSFERALSIDPTLESSSTGLKRLGAR